MAAPILSRAVRNARAMMRAAEWGDSSIPPNSALPAGNGGGLTADTRALGVSTVLSCVKALSDDLTTVPLYAFEGDPRGPHQPVEKQPRIVTEPFGPDLDPQSGIGQLVVSIAMRGNGYAFVVNRDPRTDLPDQLTILHPDAVKPTKKDGRKVFKIGREQEPYSTRDVVHFTGMMIPGSVMAVDIVTMQRVNIELAHQVSQYADGFFGSGGSPSGVISVPGQGSRAKARDVKQQWQATHGGAPNAHQPAIMFGGATWQALSVSPENAQFLQTRRYLREEICGWFSVPMQRIQAIVENASQGGGAGLDAIDAQYIKHGLLPIIASLETPWDRMLPGEDTWLGFDLDVFLRASAKVRAEIGQIHRVTGVRTIDEVRAVEGWAPLPDRKGRDPFTPLNSNTTSPTGGADNAPARGNEGDIS